MSKPLIMTHADVLAAIDLVVDEVGTESQRIRDAGSVALKANILKPAKKAIAYAERMAEFVRKIRALGDEWKALQSELDAAAPEVKEIVSPKPSQKPRKTGFKRVVTQVKPKTNFVVDFADGAHIADKQAGRVFALAIEHIGPSKVAALSLLQGEEPLVTNNLSLLKKYPKANVAIKGGWYVRTHSGTLAKTKLLKSIAKSLKIRLSIKLV